MGVECSRGGKDRSRQELTCGLSFSYQEDNISEQIERVYSLLKGGLCTKKYIGKR